MPTGNDIALVQKLAAEHTAEQHSAGDGYTSPRENWVTCSCGTGIWEWQQGYNENSDDPDVLFALHFGYVVAREAAKQALLDAAEELHEDILVRMSKRNYPAYGDSGPIPRWLRARAEQIGKDT